MRGLEPALRALVGDERVADADDRRWWHDATESQGLEARPDAVVLPAAAHEVAAGRPRGGQAGAGPEGPDEPGKQC